MDGLLLLAGFLLATALGLYWGRGWVRELFGGTGSASAPDRVDQPAEPASIPAERPEPMTPRVREVPRRRKRIPWDEAFHAWSSGDIVRMINALPLKTHPVNRHHLLNCLAEEAYKRRHMPDMAQLCIELANDYLAELPAMRETLVQLLEQEQPLATAVQRAVMCLVEQGRRDEAMGLCLAAIELDLSDGTKGGFPARLRRLEKAADRTGNRP